MLARGGAAPVALSATTPASSPSFTRAKRSPPMLVALGSTTQVTAEAASAAPTTFPPAARQAAAARLASAQPDVTPQRSPVASATPLQRLAAIVHLPTPSGP